MTDWQEPISEDPNAHPRYYNRSGEPISMLEWVNLFEPARNPLGMDYKVVARTEYETGTWVSTWGDEPYRPMIFETMVFPGKGESREDFHEEYMDLYSTEEEALEGHRRACAWVEEKLAAIKKLLGEATNERRTERG